MYQQVKDHIIGLSDAELVEYVVTGQRMYAADALAFAKEELQRRSITDNRKAELRDSIVQRVLDGDAQAPAKLPRSKNPATVCENCGFEVRNRYGVYVRRTALFVVRYTEVFEGRFCRLCHRKLFLKTTFPTFFLGWWGLLSILLTAGTLVGNLITFLRSRSLPHAPSDSGPPRLDETVMMRVAPHLNLISDRLEELTDVHEIALEIAPIAGVTPGQVWCYIRHVLRLRHADKLATPPQQRGHGLPIQPAGTPTAR